MLFLAELTKEGLLRFMNDLYEVEAGKITTVYIEPKTGGDSIVFQVTLETRSPIAHILKDSLKNGLLMNRGCGEKFSEIVK